MNAELPVEADQREAHQRRLAQGERRMPVAMAQLFEAALLLVGGEAAPVQLLPGESDALADDLQRFVEPVPEKGGAQRPVALHQPLPGLPEQRGIEVRRQGAGELADIDPGLGRQQAVEQHAVLERREGVDVFDVLQGETHSLCNGFDRDRKRDATWSKLRTSRLALGKSEGVKTSSSLVRLCWISCRSAPA